MVFFLLKVIISNGYEAVDFFYILSGFVMVLAYNDRLKTPEDNKRFWRNRFIRIYPGYILALIIYLLYLIFYDVGNVKHLFSRSLIEIFMIQSWIGKSSLNYPGWSVSVEIFFYLLFPLLLKKVYKITIWRNFVIYILSFLLIQSAYFYFCHNKYLYTSKINLIFIESPFLHLTTFYLGMCCGLVFIKHHNVLNRYKYLIKSSVYALLVIFFYSFLKISPGFLNVRIGLLAPFYALFLISFSLESYVTKFLGNKFFVFLGDISYSIYIYQLPVYVFVLLILRNNHYLMLIYVVSLLTVTVFLHFVYEKPFAVAFKSYLKAT